jgi:phosphoglycerate dehydrogenase-like enzyme
MITAVLTDSDRFPFSSDDLDRLSTAGVTVLGVPGRSREELIKAAPAAEAMFVYSAKIDREIVAHLDRCRLVVRCGSGYDNIDVYAARAREIDVAYVPGYGTQDVAEHALALMFACARRLITIDQAVRVGDWPSYLEIGPMRRLSGATLGLVGFGRIARQLGRLALGLGMQVMAHDPHLSDAAIRRAGVRPSALKELARANVISLHAPLTPATIGMINADFLEAARSDLIMINTGRGELIDEDALVEFLRVSPLAAAGLDVLRSEPPEQDHPLANLPNVLITSHTAAFTEEALTTLRSAAIDELFRHTAGEPLLNPVPTIE